MASSAPTLRPYQEQMLAAIAEARASGVNRVLCKAPTGTGKTVTFAMLLKWPPLAAWLALTPGRGARLLVIAHREELLDQAAEKIRRANPGLIVDIEQGDRHASRYADVIIASIQTLAARTFKRLDRLLARHTFPIVIVDEAHHAAAATYREALAKLGFLPTSGTVTDRLETEDARPEDVVSMQQSLISWDAVAPKDRLLVGVTATPNRSDAIGLGCVFQTIAYSYALKAAIADHWLVPITAWAIDTSESLDGVGLTHGDFNQRQLAGVVNTPGRNRLAVQAWQQYAEGLSTIAFTVDVAHAHALAEAFLVAGIRARALSGVTPKDERRQMLAAFGRGEIEVITNCMVLTEGVDLPRTGCILHAKPTKSATLYEQMTGRGLRLFPGKTECLVIDMVDVARKHSLQTAPVLYGLPPTLDPKGQRLDALEAAFEAFRVKYPGFDVEAGGRLTLEQLRLRAERIDLWTVPELAGALGPGRALNWIRVATDDYRLQYPWADGTEILGIAKDMLGHFDVSCTLRPHDGGPVRQRTLAAGILSAQAAAGLAEAFVLQERRSVTRLRDRSAPWRNRPATPKQIEMLERLRVPFKREKLSSGEASDLIDMAKLRRAR